MNAIRVPCPTCGQAEGERCRDEEGLIDVFHNTRVMLAEGYESEPVDIPCET